MTPMSPVTPMSATQTAMAQVLPLAKDLDENKVTPGVLGFIVFAALGAAVWMLMKSMNRHMKKVDFEEQPEPEREQPESGEQRDDATGTPSASTDAAPPAPSASTDADRTRPGV